MKYAIYKVKPNKVEAWKEWCRKLNMEYREEACKTLAKENYIFEGFGTFVIGNETYAVGYGLEGHGGTQKFDENHPLNKKHLEIKKECLEGIDRGESDYFLCNLKI